jgi:hypothetical protein
MDKLMVGFEILWVGHATEDDLDAIRTFQPHSFNHSKEVGDLNF